MRIGFRLLTALIGMGSCVVGHAAAYGYAKITGCAPAGGVRGECEMHKSAGDPQTYHSVHCILDRNNVIQDEVQGDTHYVPLGTGETHVFPVPVLQTPWDEGVTFCVKNFSYWWSPQVGVPLADCRTTRSG